MVLSEIDINSLPVEVILQTTQGEILQPVAIALGKTYIANISNAVLVTQGTNTPTLNVFTIRGFTTTEGSG